MDLHTLGAINILGRCAAAAVAIGGATFLAYHGKDGWGWLVFVAIILGGVTVNGKD